VIDDAERLFGAPSQAEPRLASPARADDARYEAETGEALDAGLSAIGPLVGERKTREHALVLQSMGLWHAVRPTYAGAFLLVREADAARARASITRYDEENRDWPPRPRRERPSFVGTPLAPMLFVALAAFFLLATGPVASGSRWFQHGTAVSDLVIGRQPWRAVTALTLHADSVHILGNVISGAVFASAVDRRLGPGLSALAVLASGFAGNAANALWHHAIGEGGHASIGASTAVFGAVGLLAATQLVLDRTHAPRQRKWTEIVAPLVGGAALLGSLGASPSSDLGAHLFGFLAGIVIGLPIAVGVRWRRGSGPTPKAPRWWTQASAAAIAVGTVLGCWVLALR
jgi:membrane associated rhomboid family serine protease